MHSQSFDEPSKLKGFLHVATFLFTEPMKFQVKGLKPKEPMMLLNNWAQIHLLAWMEDLVNAVSVFIWSVRQAQLESNINT